MRLTQRKGMILPAAIALVALLANAAVFAVSTYPAWRDQSAAQAAFDRSESELHAVRQQIRSLETVGRGALAAGEDLDVFLGERLLDAARWSEVLLHVRASANDAGVRLERVGHSDEPIEALNAVRWQMSVFGAGSYAAVRDWMSTLRDGPGLIYIDRAEIGGSGGDLLSVEITVVALLRAESPVRP